MTKSNVKPLQRRAAKPVAVPQTPVAAIIARLAFLQTLDRPEAIHGQRWTNNINLEEEAATEMLIATRAESDAHAYCQLVIGLGRLDMAENRFSYYHDRLQHSQKEVTLTRREVEETARQLRQARDALASVELWIRAQERLGPPRLDARRNGVIAFNLAYSPQEAPQGGEKGSVL